MMQAFTSCTNAANAAAPSPDPPPLGMNHIIDVTNSCDNHTERSRTSLQSPTGHSSPIDPQPDLTPLRRRFLDEVGMQPVTPPRTPSPTKGPAGPIKRSESPSKGRGSPTKQSLEIGPGGFYFQCELPASKITPKKKGPEAETPIRRTPSPAKMGGGTRATKSRDSSPAKQTPSKRTCLEKQTPSKAPHKIASSKQNTPVQSRVENLAAIKSSATKNGTPSKSATPKPLSATSLRKPATPQSDNGGQSGRPSPTKSIRLASKFAQNAVTPKPPRTLAPQAGVKQGAASNDTVVAASSSSTDNPRPPLSSFGKAQTRPARVGSFDIGQSMASLSKHTPQPRKVESDRPTGGSDVSGPPTPLRKAGEKLDNIEYIRLPDDKDGSTMKKPEIKAQTVHSADAGPETHVYALPFFTEEQTSHYRPLPLALEASHSSETKPTTTSSKKQVNFLGSEPTPSRLPRLKTMRRAGTDPLLHLAMQKEMNTLSKSLSDSLGVDFRATGTQNTAELPSMATTFLGSKQGTPHPKKRNLLLRTTSDLTDVSNVSASSISIAGSGALVPQEQPATLSTPNVAKVGDMSLPKGTPARIRKDIRGGAKNPDGQNQLRKVTSHGSGFTRPQSAASISTASSQRNPTTRVLAGTPTSTRAIAATPRPKFAVTPVKPKVTGTIPQSARKSAFHSPARKTATPGQSKTSQRPIQAEAQHEPAPRPVFVGAQDIAARIANWNKPTAKAKESYTPPGSPPKPKTPTSTSANAPTVAGQKMPTSLHPKTPKHLGFTPKRPAPATSVQGRTPVHIRTLARVRGDPMATRTPSKGIQESLSQAIDQKLEEDKVREFKGEA